MALAIASCAGAGASSDADLQGAAKKSDAGAAASAAGSGKAGAAAHAEGGAGASAKPDAAASDPKAAEQLAACEARDAVAASEQITLSFSAQCLPEGNLEATGVVGQLRVHMASGSILSGKITLAGVMNECDPTKPAALEFSQRPSTLPLLVSDGQSLRVKIDDHARLGATQELSYVRIWDTEKRLIAAAYRGLPADSKLDTQDLGFTATIVRECDLRTDTPCFESQTRLALDIVNEHGDTQRMFANDLIKLNVSGRQFALVLFNSLFNRHANGQCSDNMEGQNVSWAMLSLE